MDYFETISLGSLYSFSSGLSKGRQFFGKGYEFVSFKDVFYNYFLPEKLTELVESTEKEQNACSIKRGDVFLTRTSETMDELGQSSVALKDYPNATFNGFTKRLRPLDSKSIIPEYAGYYFRSPKFRAQISSFATMTTRASLNNEILNRLTIDLPPIKIQKKIGEILKSLDDKIELNIQINQNLEALAQALFKQWFVDFEFPNENGEPYKSSGGEMIDSELGEIPKGWKIYNYGELLETVSKTYPLKKVDQVIFLNTGDIQNGKFLHKNFSKTDQLPGQAKKSIQRGDILYSEIRPQNKRFAYVHFNAEKFVVSTKLMVLRPKVDVDPLFMYFLLTQEEVIGYLQILAESRSGTFPQITFSEVSTLKIALPEFEEVNSFSDKVLRSYFEHSFNMDFENEGLSELRDTLLPKLISGELEVSEASLEPTF